MKKVCHRRTSRKSIVTDPPPSGFLSIFPALSRVYRRPTKNATRENQSSPSPKKPTPEPSCRVSLAEVSPGSPHFVGVLLWLFPWMSHRSAWFDSLLAGVSLYDHFVLMPSGCRKAKEPPERRLQPGLAASQASSESKELPKAARQPFRHPLEPEVVGVRAVHQSIAAVGPQQVGSFHDLKVAVA